MAGLRAYVKNGRIVMDEPTMLPEGTVLDLVVDDEGDDLDETERKARDRAIDASWKAAKQGDGRPAKDVIDHLRRR